MPSQPSLFGNLLEAVPDALVGVDKAGVIRLVNRQTATLFGYERADLIGASLETLVPKSLRGVHAAHRAAYNADPRTRRMGTGLRLNGRRHDGTEFPIDVALSPILLSPSLTGGRMLVIAAVRDMTTRDRTRHEDELMSRGLAVLEFSGEALISTSSDGIITSWNPGAERLYGYASEEIIGKSAACLLPEDRTGDLSSLLASVGAGETIESLETQCVRKDGVLFWASITASPIRDEHGRIVGASVIVRDVSRQRKAFATAQRLAAIVESSDDAIIGFSLDGVITSWNPAAERLYGYSGEEMIGSPGGFLTPEDRAQETRAAMEQIRTGQRVEHLETLRIHRDGTVFPVSITVSPIRGPDGSIIGGSTIARDLTRQVRALRAIADQQTGELERLAELERFQRLTVGRELKMIELKKEIEYLREYGPADGGRSDDQH